MTSAMTEVGAGIEGSISVVVTSGEAVGIIVHVEMMVLSEDLGMIGKETLETKSGVVENVNGSVWREIGSVNVRET
jgi:hypothetical protein